MRLPLRFVLLSGLFALCAVARAETTDCTVVNSVPFTINAAGIYCLKDSFYNVSDGITVKADDVVLDLNGHTLDGQGFGTGVGVYAVDQKNVTVRNGTIRDFGWGVGFEDPGGKSGGHIVEDLRLTENRGAGIYAQGRAIIVRRNLLIGNGYYLGSGTGIWIGRGPGVHITHNEIVDMIPGDKESYTVSAIFVSGAPGTSVQHNVIRNAAAAPGTTGVVVSGSSGASVVGNRIAGMATGIRFLGGTGLYLDNTVGGASTPFAGGTAAGATNFSF
jgi:nitrous oxidase accessory protein NosD